MKNYRYTDEQMLGALRRVAVVVGSAALSGPVYMAHRRPDEPSRCAISTRFRTWREAVTIAGLETVSEAGGARRQCVVCGLEYSGLSGRNDRKTCSRSCYLVLRARYRRPQVTDQALRWRARQQADVSKCRRCGVESAHAAIEVHHRDGNPANNDVTNLEPLCRRCHKSEHRSLPAEASCRMCGAAFRPRRAAQRFCRKSCAGRHSASVRYRAVVIAEQAARAKAMEGRWARD